MGHLALVLELPGSGSGVVIGRFRLLGLQKRLIIVAFCSGPLFILVNQVLETATYRWETRRKNASYCCRPQIVGPVCVSSFRVVYFYLAPGMLVGMCSEQDSLEDGR
jgi:hypothetical protein